MRVPFSLMMAAALTASCIPALGFDASVPPAQRSAILFSWDGVPREHLMECLGRRELPNLAALIKEGSIVNIDITSHQTATKAGHVQMLTGYDPDITGTMSNDKFKAIPEGLSIFERLEKAFGDQNITTMMVTGALHHIGACPPSRPEQIEKAKAELAKPDSASDAPSGEARAELKAVINNTQGEPFYHVSKNIDVWDGESRRSCKVNGPIMLKYLDKYGKDRFFTFCHFLDPDHEGHAYGENSKEYNEAIVACDRWVGEVVKKLKSLGVYDRTMVFVTSDHGFDEGRKGHSNAPRVALAGNMKRLVGSGDQRDIVPTILVEMGVDITKLQPKYNGAMLTSTADPGVRLPGNQQ